jgi:cyclic pyranopterin phosphate synthase
MIDPFGRPITYLRVSVTDRCDLRCVYCMAEDMTFLPKRELLTLEELDRLSGAFIRLGTTKIRITGGEPLVRRDIGRLFQSLGARLGSGLNELTVTTNGTQLTKHAWELFAAGVRRINVSLDSLDPARFTQLTRWARSSRHWTGFSPPRPPGSRSRSTPWR